MGKYTPLEKYLKNRVGEEKEITLSFERIESIIEGKLPNSAYRHQAWWANEKNPKTHVQKFAWRNAGWKVDSYNLSKRIVRFIPIRRIIIR